MHKKIILSTLTLLASAASIFGQASPGNTGDQLAYVSSLYMGAESLRQSSEFIDNQVFGSGGLSVGFGYADYDYDDDVPRNFEGDFKTGSISLAYVHEFESFNAGLSFSYADGESEADATDNVGGLESDADGWLISLFAGKQWERLSLSAKGTVGELSVDTTRQTNAAITSGFAARTSDSDLTMYQLELVAFYVLLSNDDLGLSPFAKLGYSSIENDSFSESPIVFDAIAVNEIEDDSPYAEIGILLDCKAFDSFKPYASLSVWQDLGDDEVDFEATNLNRIPPPPPIETPIPDAAETVIKAKLGFDYLVSEDISLGASLGVLSGDDLDGANIAFSASWLF